MKASFSNMARPNYHLTTTRLWQTLYDCCTAVSDACCCCCCIRRSVSMTRPLSPHYSSEPAMQMEIDINRCAANFLPGTRPTKKKFEGKNSRKMCVRIEHNQASGTWSYKTVLYATTEFLTQDRKHIEKFSLIDNKFDV